VKDEQATVDPPVIVSELRFREAPDVPTSIVATTVVPLDSSRHAYPAVPPVAFVSLAIALAVAVTMPPLAVAVAKAVEPKVSLATSEPVSAPLIAGWVPVMSWRKPLLRVVHHVPSALIIMVL
jgi:hypothetical protein